MSIFDAAYNMLEGGGSDQDFASSMDYAPSPALDNSYSFEQPQYDFGSMGSQGLAGGPSTSFVNYDPMQAFQQSWNQFNNQFTSYQPSVPKEPSLFQRIISGALTGIAGGAGAPDAGSAFSGGFQAVMAADEANRQRRLQEEALAQQQKYQQMQMMGSYINIMKAQKELELMPEQVKMEQQQLLMQQANIMKGYADPIGIFQDGDPKLQEIMQYYTQNPGEPLPVAIHGGGQTILFRPEQRFPADAPPLDMGYGISLPVAGQTYEEVAKMKNELNFKLIGLKMEEQQANQQHQFRLGEIGAQGAETRENYQYQVDHPMPGGGVQGREDVNNQIEFYRSRASQVGYEIGNLESERQKIASDIRNAQANGEDSTFLQSEYKRVNDQITQAKQQQQQIMNTWGGLALPQKQGKGGSTTSTIPGELPFADQIFNFAASMVGKIWDHPKKGPVRILSVDPDTHSITWEPAQ